MHRGHHGNPTLLGQLAVANRFVGREKLREATEIHRADPAVPLGQVLLHGVILTHNQLDSLLGQQQRLREDHPLSLGDLVREKALAEPPVLHRMLDVQQTLAEAGRPAPLGRLLMGAHILQPAQVLDLLREQGIDVLGCQTCRTVHALRSAAPCDRICPECEGPRITATPEQFETWRDPAALPALPAPMARSAARARGPGYALASLGLLLLLTCGAVLGRRPAALIQEDADGTFRILETEFQRAHSLALRLANEGRPRAAREAIAQLLERYPQVEDLVRMSRLLPPP